MEYEEDLEVLDDYDLEWDTSRNKYHVYPKSSTRLSYTGSDYASALEHPYSSAAKVQAKESVSPLLCFNGQELNWFILHRC